MKIILIMPCILMCQLAVAKTGSKEVISSGIYDWGYVAEKDVKWCDLPTVDRDGGDRIAGHRLIVETVMDHVTETTERIPLQTGQQFEYEDCNSHKDKIIASIRDHHGQLPVTLYYTDKKITRCSGGNDSICKHECIRTIETKINNVRYFNDKQISEEFCNQRRGHELISLSRLLHPLKPLNNKHPHQDLIGDSTRLRFLF